MNPRAMMGAESMEEVDAKYFRDKTWLIYGRLPTIAKKDSVAAIEDRGGRIIKSVSGKLDFLVMAGPTPELDQITGVKARDALKVGAVVIGEPDFLRLLEGEDPFEEGAQEEEEELLSPLPPELARWNYPAEDVDIDATYFEGKTWYVFGEQRVQRYGTRVSKGQVSRLLRNKSAKIASKLHEGVDFILHEGPTPLWGARLTDEIQEARDRGVPIFGIDDLYGLLHHDRDGSEWSLPRPPSDEVEPSEQESFGELRHQLHGMSEMFPDWHQLFELLDDMSEGALEGAVPYVEEHLDRLSPEVRAHHAERAGNQVR